MTTIYAKTADGRDEIETRARRLAPVLRSMLLLVDGSRDARELDRIGAGLHAPGDALRQLEALGLIEAVTAAARAAGAAVDAGPQQAVDAATLAPSQRYRLLAELMSEAVRQHLGLRGFMMQLKIERCANADELTALRPELEAAIRKAKGAPVAASWSEAVQAALPA